MIGFLVLVIASANYFCSCDSLRDDLLFAQTPGAVHPVRTFFINGATWGCVAESEVPAPAAPRPPSGGLTCGLVGHLRTRRRPAPDWSGSDLLPRRWEVLWPVLLQGVCSAVQLSDRRDRVLLLVLSLVRRAAIHQVGTRRV